MMIKLGKWHLHCKKFFVKIINLIFFYQNYLTKITKKLVEITKSLNQESIGEIKCIRDKEWTI